MRSGEESRLSEDQGRLNIPERSNIGILGLGRMGYLYAGTIAQVPGADLYAVADVSEQARASIAAEFNFPHQHAQRPRNSRCEGEESGLLLTGCGEQRRPASIEIGIAATRSQKEGRPVALDEVRQLVS
jgi:hypothetical protein